MNKHYITLILCLLSLAGLTTAQTFNWEEQLINDRSENLQNFAAAEDGSATIVGYGNTFVRTTDGGTSWQDTEIFSEADNFDYQSISFSGNLGFAVAMTGFKVIYRATNADLYANSPVLKTTDGGETWTLITVANMGSGDDASINLSALGNTQVKFEAVKVIDQNTVYLAASWKDIEGNSHKNIFKSSDTGETWEPIIPDNGSNTISSIVTYNGYIYIAGKETLYKVAIADNTVTDLYPIVHEGVDDAMFFWNTTIAGNELIFPTTKHGILVTSNEGGSFSTIPNIAKGYFVYKHDDNHIVVIGGKNDTKATSDGGINWTTVSAGESLWNGGVVGDSLVTLGKNEIFTMALADIGAGSFAWNKRKITDISGNLKGIATKGDTTFITGYKDIFIKSTDGGQTFTEVTLPSKSDIIYASVDMDLRGLGQGKGGAAIASTRRYKLADFPTDGPDDYYIPGFLLATNDNWTTYNVLDDAKVGEKYGETPSTNPNAIGCHSQDYYVVECIDDTTMFTFVQWYDTVSTDTKITYGRVFKTVDGGDSWDTITSDFGNKFITNISFDGDTGYISGNKTLLKTTDGGATFTTLDTKLTNLGATDPYIQDVVIKNDTLYVPTTNDGVFVSYDAGESFAKINGIYGASGFVAVDADSWMTLGSSAKTHYTNDAGDSWESCYPGSTTYSTGGIYNGNIIALCKGKIFKLAVTDLDAISTAISETSSDFGNIRIFQRESDINIISDKVISRCTLYSISGQTVGRFSPNTNTFIVNASHLKAGIYLVTVESEGKISTSKFVIK